MTGSKTACREGVDRHCSEFTVPLGGRLDLTKLACQAVFVISFYDLSRPGTRHRSAQHGRFPDRNISTWGQPIDKTEGVSARNLRVRPRRSRGQRSCRKFW
jgi:hypothetical protein